MLAMLLFSASMVFPLHLAAATVVASRLIGGIIGGLSRKGKGDTMAFRVIKPFLTGSIAIVHESNSTMLIVKDDEIETLKSVVTDLYLELLLDGPITGARVAPAQVMENAHELQKEEKEER
jgi:hypothetical protein